MVFTDEDRYLIISLQQICSPIPLRIGQSYKRMRFVLSSVRDFLFGLILNRHSSQQTPAENENLSHGTLAFCSRPILDVSSAALTYGSAAPSCEWQ